MSFSSLFGPDMTSHLSAVLLHSLWQGLLVWLVIVIVLRSLKKHSAGLRYGLNVTGLWVMLFLPVLTWFLVDVNEVPTSVSVRAASVDDVSQDRVNSVNIPIDMTQVDSVWSLDEHETTPAETPESADQNLDESAFISPVAEVNSSASPQGELPSLVVAAVWLTGVLLLSLRLLMGYVWTLRVSYSRLPIDSELRMRLESISASLGWKTMPRVFLSSHIKEAIVVGYLKPLVLIPITWTTQLTPEAIEAVIIHELTHIRRFDLWVILVQRITETLLFFHPAVWSLSKRISYERELCCDAESSRLLNSSLSYATALEQVARYLFEQNSPSRQTNWLTHTLSPTFGGQKMELLARVQHVLSLSSNTPRPPIKPRRHYHGLTMLMIPVVLLGLGISLVHATGEEPVPTDQSGQILTKPKKGGSSKEEKRDTGKLLFGVGVNSDAGVVGQIVVEDFSQLKAPLLPTDIVAIVNETPVTAFDVLGELLARLSKEQHKFSAVEFRAAQDRMLEKRLPPHIDQLLMVNAVKARLTADQLDKIMGQLDGLFEEQIDRMKQQFDVTETEELHALLDEKGTSLELLKNRHANRQLGIEYLRGKLSEFNDDVSSDRESQTKQIIDELRKTATIKTIFDDDWELPDIVSESHKFLAATDVVAIVNGSPVEAIAVVGTFIGHVSQKLQSCPPEMFDSMRDGLLKDQDRILKKYLPRHVDRLLLASAYQAHMSEDELEEAARELDRLFEKQIHYMNAQFGVVEAKEILAQSDEAGMPLEFLKNNHKNQTMASAYLSIELAKFNDDASSKREAQTKQIIDELRKSADIKTIFDDDWALHKPVQADNAVALNSEKDDAKKENANPFADLEFIETPDGPAIDISHEQFQKKRYQAELDGENWPQVFETAAFAGNTNDTFQQIRKLKGIVDPLGGKLISMSGIRQEILDNDPTRIRVTLLRKDMTVNIHYGSDPKAEMGSEDLPRIPPPLSDEILQALADLDVPFRLFLTRDTATDDSLARLVSNKQLVAILVESKHVTEDGLKSLLKIPQLKQLEWLAPCTASGLVEIAKHRSIESLMINAKLLDSESIKPLGDLVQLNRLSISLGRNLDGTFINTLLKLKNLETLQLQFVQLSVDDLKQLQALKNLKTLSFNLGLDDDLRLNDDMVKAALSLPGLQNCALHHATLSAETLTYLKGSDAAENTKKHRSPCLIYDCTVIDESGGRKTHDLISIHRADKPTPQASPRRQDSSDYLEIEYSKLPAEWKRKLNKQEQKAWAEVAQVHSRETLQIEQPPGSKLQFARWKGMYLRGVKLQIDNDKKNVVVENGLFQHEKDGVLKMLQADRIEIHYSQKFQGQDPDPLTVQAIGNVRYSYQHSPVLEPNPSLIRGDELTWDLVKNVLEVRSETQVIRLQNSTEKAAVSAPLPTDIDQLDEAKWNARNLAALDEIVEMEYPSNALKEVVADINRRYLQDRLTLDMDGLRDLGITENVEVELILSGITLRSTLKLLLEPMKLEAVYDRGKVILTSVEKEKNWRVTRHHKVAKVLAFNKFYSESPAHVQLDQDGRVDLLIDFLQRIAQPQQWEEFGGGSTIKFDLASQTLTVLAPQKVQRELFDHVELLQRIAANQWDLRTRQLLSKAKPRLDHVGNVIASSLVNDYGKAIKKRDGLTFEEQLIHDQLAKRISVDFNQKPLSHLAQHLANTLGINIVVDERGLSEVGLTSSTPITVQLENVRLATLLKHALNSLNLDYKIEDEVLKITSRERAQGPIHVTIYKLDESIIDPDQFEEDVDSLIEIIRTTVSPNSWDQVGGAGAIAAHPNSNSIIIRQNGNVHNEVQEFLKSLQDARKGEQPEPAPELPEPTPEEKKVNRELKKLMSMNLKDVPLSQFFQKFRDQTGLQLYVDRRGLLEAGMVPELEISCPLEGMGQTVLKGVLTSLGLDYRVEENVIVISSPERCSGPFSTVIYSTKGLPKEKLGLKGLSQHLMKSVAYGTWVNHGGSGVVTFDAESESLIIRQSARVHQQLVAYLENMRLPLLDDDESHHFNEFPLR